jgi:serine/threonine-protein kinase
MMVEFQCEGCGEFLESDSAQKGHEIVCDSCSTAQFIPLQGSIEVGNIIEDHMVTKELGQGAMGKVYLASHLLMNRDVALKTISPKIRQDGDSVQQFIKELQVGAQLSHPNIVTVYTAGFNSGVYYISMQYIDGYDMSSRVEDTGPIPEAEALNVVRTVSDAMAYAWSDFKMIHRDIKPENLRVSSRGNIMVMDFGLAMNTGELEGEEGLIVGTPDFMSPEQASADPNLDFRSDMYSLGVVLFYLLSGQRPYESGNPMDVVAKHINEPLPAIADKNPNVKVSKATLRLLAKMTAKDKTQRFESWGDVCKAIDDIFSGKAAKTTKAGRTTKSPKTTKVSAGKSSRPGARATGKRKQQSTPSWPIDPLAITAFFLTLFVYYLARYVLDHGGKLPW